MAGQNHRLTRFEITDEQIDGDDYFAVIEPVFLSVSIYDGPEVYEKDLSRFTREQRHLLACHWYLSEVNNGGHDQFFNNNTGIVWKDAKDGFGAIHVKEIQRIIEEAAERLGGASLDHEARLQQMDATDARFDDLDERLFELEKQLDLETSLMDYIRKNRSKFYFSGDVINP